VRGRRNLSSKGGIRTDRKSLKLWEAAKMWGTECFVFLSKYLGDEIKENEKLS
jgi:hypothetical protein